MSPYRRLLPTLIVLPALTLLLVAQDVIPAKSLDEVSSEFKCPGGTHDSGRGPAPGVIVRWCDVQQNGRLLYHGPVWRWYPSGKLEAKEYYLNGSAAGVWPSYYENGKMSSVGNWVNGSKAGLWKFWREDGSLVTEVTYSLNGNARTDYYPDGTRKAVGTFVQSGKIGKWIYWGQDGKEKARCDFGSGVIKIADSGCSVIAKELDPEGYSLPIPAARKVSDRHLSLSIGSSEVKFAVPLGWFADIDAGRSDDLPVVFYPTGKGWRSGAPNIYIRVMFKEGVPFERVVKSEFDEFRSGVSDYREGKTRTGRLKNGREYLSKSISYKPVISTDSPFSIVASNRIHEKVVYINSSNDFALLLVLTAETEREVQKSTAALDGLLRSSD